MVQYCGLHVDYLQKMRFPPICRLITVRKILGYDRLKYGLRIIRTLIATHYSKIG